MKRTYVFIRFDSRTVPGRLIGIQRKTGLLHVRVLRGETSLFPASAVRVV